MRSRVGVFSRDALSASQTAFTPSGSTTAATSSAAALHTAPVASAASTHTPTAALRNAPRICHLLRANSPHSDAGPRQTLPPNVAT